MNEILSKALNPVILIFLISTMLSCGLSLTIAQIFNPLRNVRLAVSAVLASYFIVPLIAVAVSRGMGIEEPFRQGLVLLCMAAGAEAGPKLVGKANGNVGVSVGLLVASIMITIVYIPFMLSLLLPEVHIDRGALLIKLCLTVLLPIIIGLFLKARHGGIADRLNKYVHMISTGFMFLMAAFLILLNYKQMFGLLGTGAPLAAVIVVVLSFITGYIFGWPDRGTRLAMAFMHGGRNASIALMIAGQVFGDEPNVLTMITVTVVLMLIIFLPASYLIGRSQLKF